MSIPDWFDISLTMAGDSATGSLCFSDDDVSREISFVETVYWIDDALPTVPSIHGSFDISLTTAGDSATGSSCFPDDDISRKTCMLLGECLLLESVVVVV